MRDAAERLIAMAERIRKNAPEEFSGCIVVLPPEGPQGLAGDPIEILLLDPKQDRRGRNFWATAKSEVEIGEHKFNQQTEQNSLGFR
jgi:hypothetical protein